MVVTIISRLFDPFVMLVAMCVLLFWSSPQFVPAMALMIGLPFILYVAAWKTHVISDWDIKDRRQRPKILWSMFALEIFASLVLQTSALVPFLVLFAGFAIITHFWKISGHVMCVALVTGMFVQKFGWAVWPVLLCVPLVAWARVIGKFHTVAQVIAGAAYSILFLVIYNIFVK